MIRKKVLTRKCNIWFPIRTNYVIPDKITATHAGFGRFIVADHDIHVRCDYACFQTFPRAFYDSNFATQRLWILVCFNILKAIDIIFLIGNNMYNQKYHDNCRRLHNLFLGYLKLGKLVEVMTNTAAENNMLKVNIKTRKTAVYTCAVW